MLRDLIPPGRVMEGPEFLWLAANKKPMFQLLERVEDDFEPSRPQTVLAYRPHTKGSVRAYKPLEDEHGLFLTFAATPPTPEGVLQFANRYGALGFTARIKVVPKEEPGNSDYLNSIFYPGEDLQEQKRLLWHKRYGGPRMEAFAAWRDEINWMHHLTGLWQAVENLDRDALKRSITWQDGKIVHRWQPLERFEPEFDYRSKGEEIWQEEDFRAPDGDSLFRPGELVGPALLFVMRKINDRINGAVYPQLCWSLGRRRPELTYRVDQLLAAMYWQFAQALDKGFKFRQCPVCLKTFQLARGETRTDRLTCSNTCRTYLYRQRIDEARRLHRHGQTPASIAKKLNASLATVKTWIAKEQ